MNPHSEINALNESDCRAAIGLAEANMDSVVPEYRPELAYRLTLLRERLRRLTWTNDRIRRTQGR